MSSIDIFPWDDNFNTGLPKVDEQHRKLVELLNQLASHVAFESDPLEMNAIFDELLAYAVYHFDTEETIWHEFMPDDESESEHKEAHRQFVQVVRRLKASQEAEPSAQVAEQALAFLTRWLAHHILDTDRRMAYVVQAMQSGLPLEAAKSHAAERMTGMVRVLIDVILKIYDTLSSNTLNLMREIADRVEARRRLEVSEARLRDTLDNSPNVAVQWYDRAGRILYWNSGSTRLFGWSAEEALGKTLGQLFATPEEGTDLQKALEHIATTGGRFGPMELKSRNRDGQAVVVESTMFGIPGDVADEPVFVCLDIDITGRKQAEQALRHERETLQLILDYAPIGIWLQDGTGRLAFVNKAFCQATGIPEERFLAVTHYSELIPEAFRAQCLASDAKALSSQGISETRQRLPFVDGKPHDLRVIKAVKRDERGEPEALVGLSLDITEELAQQRALYESEERLRLAMSVAEQAWFEVALDTGKVTVSPEYPRMIGYDAETFSSDFEHWRENIHPDDREATLAAFEACARDGGPYTMDYRRRTGNGGWKWIRSVGKIVQWDESGRALRMVGIHTDITPFKEHERQLEHIAHFDALTGLPNRTLLADRLHQGMAQAQRRGNRLAVAYVDLDGFKTINDAHGHDTGDMLLTVLATRMKQALRDGDTIARLGGDEFVAVLLDLADNDTCINVLNRLLAAAAEPVSTEEGLSLRVSASLGVAFYPQSDEIDADQLLRQADQAMYQAKLAGKNRFHLFDAEHDRTLRGLHESLERIRQALAEREFELFYQPKVNMRTGAVIGAEALIRWHHPVHGLLTPGGFLPVIANHPLSVELGEWVFDAALTQIDSWKAAGFDFPVSVNVDAMHLQHPDFVNRLRERLARHPKLGPGDLELEIVESSALEDMAQVTQVMLACREHGIDFALDDFGTGYSSLTYLRRLPAGQIKLDQSFVRGMLDDPDDLAILEGILGLADAFRRRVVAEGVETLEHGEMLLRLGCELGQGYAIARPMPADQIPAWLASWQPDTAWSKLPAYRRDDLPTLYAAVEYRAWIAALADHLKGERGVPPSLDQEQSRFVAWLKQARHDRWSGYRDIDELHRKIQALVAELLALKHQGQSKPALERLGEIHSLRDGLIRKMLGFVMQGTVFEIGGRHGESG